MIPAAPPRRITARLRGRPRAFAAGVWRTSTSWHSTPVPMVLRSARYHRRLYNPWSGRFTQKMLRYMRTDWIAHQGALADKLAVRQYVVDRIGPGYLTEIHDIADTFDQLDPSRLPERFYLKANHGSGYNLACPDRALLDVAACRDAMAGFLASDYTSTWGETQYRGIERKVYVEEFLDLDAPGAMMLRLFAFDGHVAAILVDTVSGRTEPLAHGVFLPDWTPAPFRLGPDLGGVDVDRPHNLTEVLEIGSALSKGVPFVRVDLYWLDGRIVFSELTLTPSAGHRRVVPATADHELGALFCVPRGRSRGER